MNQKQLDQLQEDFRPLKEVEGLRAVLVYGSAAREERVEGSDIDILVLVEDRESAEEAEKIMKDIEEESGFDIHLQPPRTMKDWYRLLIKGKPWAVTCARQAQSIIDPQDLNTMMKTLLNETGPHSPSKRAGELYGDADENIKEAEDILKEELVEKTIQEVYRAGNAYLRFTSRPAASPRQIAPRLEERLDEDMDFYRELLGVRQGRLESDQFDLSKLDSHRDRALEIIDKVQFRFRNEISDERERIENEVRKEIKKTCARALEEEDIQFEEDEVVGKFVKEMIENGPISEEYLDFIEQKGQVSGIYEPLAHLKDFRTAVKDATSGTYTDEEFRGDSRLEPYNEFEEKLLKRTDSIAGIFALTIENFLHTGDVTTVVIHRGDENIKQKCEDLEKEIADEYGFNIHSRVETVGKYWKKVNEDGPVAVQELDYAAISYDPHGLLESLKEIEKQGAFPSSPGWVQHQLENAPVKIIQPTESAKLETLKKLYDASVKLGQAVLLDHGIAPPPQKKVSESLRSQAGGELDERHIETIETAIELYKNLEYDEKESVDAEELEDLDSRVRDLKEQTAEIINVV